MSFFFWALGAHRGKKLLIVCGHPHITSTSSTSYIASPDPERLLQSEESSSGLTHEGQPTAQVLAKEYDSGEEPNEPAAFSIEEPDSLDLPDKSKDTINTECKSASDSIGDTRPIAANARSNGGGPATPKPQRHRKGKSGASRSRSPRKPSVKRENSSPTSLQEAKSFKSEKKNSVNDKTGNASRSKGDSKIK